MDLQLTGPNSRKAYFLVMFFFFFFFKKKPEIKEIIVVGWI